MDQEIASDGCCFPVLADILGIEKDSVQPHMIQCNIQETICDNYLLFIRSRLYKLDLEGNEERWQFLPLKFAPESLLVFYHSSKDQLRFSATAGCSICRQILQARIVIESDFLVFFEGGWPNDAEHAYSLLQREPRLGSNFYVAGFEKINNRNHPNSDLYASFEYSFVIAGSEGECLQLPDKLSPRSRSYPSFHPDSEKCFNQIQQWLSNCVYQHDKCCRPRLPLPLRLLEIHSADGVRWQIVLRESKMLLSHDDVHYVSLSYCWGNVSYYSTTKQNISERLKNIPFEDLPEVAQDTIKVVGKLGIRYLWIDALCICQDDSSEWAQEAARMATTCGGSIFTLSALAGFKATDSFLQDRQLKPILIGDVTSQRATYNQNQIYLRRRPRFNAVEIKWGPLSRRAWPLQERILAPAVLYYGRDQTIWECNEIHLCSETGEMLNDSNTSLRVSKYTPGRTLPGSKPDLWNDIVEEFTRRDLTLASDRLPAISGIVSRLRQEGFRHGRYVAGLWESELAFGLLWTCLSNQTSFGDPVKPNLHVASWSWACRNIEARPYFEGSEDPVIVLSRHPRFCIDDPQQDAQSQLGPETVSSCPIKLGGYLQKICEAALRIDIIPYTLRDTILKALDAELPGDNQALSAGWRFDHVPFPPGPYYCLRVAELREPVDFYSRPSIEYLILRDAGTSPNVYMRIGRLTLCEMPQRHYIQPYPDVICRNGEPLLQDGNWKDITLV